MEPAAACTCTRMRSCMYTHVHAHVRDDGVLSNLSLPAAHTVLAVKRKHLWLVWSLCIELFVTDPSPESLRSLSVLLKERACARIRCCCGFRIIHFE